MGVWDVDWTTEKPESAIGSIAVASSKSLVRSIVRTSSELSKEEPLTRHVLFYKFRGIVRSFYQIEAHIQKERGSEPQPPTHGIKREFVSGGVIEYIYC